MRSALVKSLDFIGDIGFLPKCGPIKTFVPRLLVISKAYTPKYRISVAKPYRTAVRARSGIKKAVERARRGDGPTMLECITYRYEGHEEGDTWSDREDKGNALWTLCFLDAF